MIERRSDPFGGTTAPDANQGRHRDAVGVVLGVTLQGLPVVPLILPRT